jgi:threonine/homoserine/homoserine lactone efflux protein
VPARCYAVLPSARLCQASLEARFRPAGRILTCMTVIRQLFGTVGVLLGSVLLILGIILSPVLLLLAPIPILVYLAWKFWRARRKVSRGVERQRKRGRKLKKRVEKSI